MSGTVGVVAVTAGPGLTNAVTAIKNAQMAQSPVLLLGKRLFFITCCARLKVIPLLSNHLMEELNYISVLPEKL